MMIDIVPKFYSAIPQPITSRSRSGQGHGLRNFNVTDLNKSSYFPYYTMDCVQIWHDDRYNSKVLFSNTLLMSMISMSGSQT